MVPRKQGKAISTKLNVRQNLLILNIIHTRTNTQFAIDKSHIAIDRQTLVMRSI